MPITASSFLPLPKVTLIKSELYFPTTAHRQAFPFLKTARTQRVQFESKGTFFPSPCQQTLLLPRATLLPAFCFGTVLSPIFHITHTRSLSVWPQSSPPSCQHIHHTWLHHAPCPTPWCPVRAPRDCQPGAGQGMLPLAHACTKSELLPWPRARSAQELLISYYDKLKY